MLVAEIRPDKPKRYWVSASQESIGRDNVWYAVPGLCNHADVKSGFTNPAIPVFPTGVRGITFPSRDGLAEEKILFCPAWQPSWTAFDNARTNDGLHYRAMHVPIGGTPTERQRELARDLASNGGRNVMWFKNFFIKTLIHESTHATAFTTTRLTKLGMSGSMISPLSNPQNAIYPAANRNIGSRRLLY
jgi:hypothetical protein